MLLHVTEVNAAGLCLDVFFMNTIPFGLKSLIKNVTCYKNPENPNSIDFILTNNLRSFQNSCYRDRFIGFL